MKVSFYKHNKCTKIHLEIKGKDRRNDKKERKRITLKWYISLIEETLKKIVENVLFLITLG